MLEEKQGFGNENADLSDSLLGYINILFQFLELSNDPVGPHPTQKETCLIKIRSSRVLAQKI